MFNTLEITTRVGCANNCSYCPQKILIETYFKKSDKIELSVEDFSKILSKIPKNVRIDFAGFCEPFFNKNCSKMVELTNKSGFDIAVYTTLFGMSLEDYISIRNIPFVIFQIHFPDCENKTNMVITNEYLALLDFVCRNKPKNLGFTLFGKINPLVKNVLDKYGIVVEDFSKALYNRAGNVSVGGKPDWSGSWRVVCLPSSDLKHNVLLPNGDVVVCCMDYGLKHVLGNLLLCEYDSLFESKEYDRLRYGRIEDTICAKCDLACKFGSLRYFKYKFCNSRFYPVFDKVRKGIKYVR